MPRIIGDGNTTQLEEAPAPQKGVLSLSWRSTHGARASTPVPPELPRPRARLNLFHVQWRRTSNQVQQQSSGTTGGQLQIQQQQHLLAGVPRMKNHYRKPEQLPGLPRKQAPPLVPLNHTCRREERNGG